MTETVELNKLTQQYLECLGRFGLRDLPATSERRLTSLLPEGSTAGDVSEPVSLASASVKQSALPVDPTMKVRETDPVGSLFETTGSYGQSLDVEQRVARLDALRQVVAKCTRCPELSSCRTQTVFGTGSPNPRLCFFGEGPGADEDRLGEPFVGRAGELLNRIIAACKMRREDVYILNTVKCRPPGNRNPHDEEIENCREYYEQQLEILKPEFICALGAVAAKTLLNTSDSIGRLRGKFLDWRGSKVIVTYHPAYLLRTPQAKAKTWEDMKMLMKAMGVEL